MSLLSRQSSHSDEDLKDAVEHVETSPFDELDTIETTRCSKYAWLVSLTAAVGGFLFGYDTGIISAILVYLGDDLGKTLNGSEKELVTSITSGGAFIGAVVAGLCADRYGRKMGIYTGCILFIVGAIIQAASYSIAQMTVGRAVVGLGVGSAAMIVPLYIAEVAPAKYRGRMISLDNLSITTGQLVSYGIGAAFASVFEGWRYMAGIGVVPAIVLCCLLPFCPESPRQLIYHHKRDEAAKVIAKIFPDGTQLQVQQKVQHISIHVETHRNADKTLWWQIKQLYVVPSNFRVMFAACGLMAVSQLGGFNSILYYSGTIFAAVGFDKPIAVGTIIAATNWVFTWINLLLVDRVGRRQILMNSLWVMAAAMACAAICFHWVPISPELEITSTQTGWAADVVLVCMVVFVAFYSIGAGNIAWMSSEFYPIEVRAVGTMLLTMSCWGSNVIVSSTFLTQMENITPSGAFGFYAAISFFGWIGIYFCYPEVKGMTLEDIREVFQHGFGVSFAREKQKELKRVAQNRNPHTGEDNSEQA
ncbi:hypothetical protein N7532_006319 [Penicillium argentinense]|uniref:Major facilitator superfamily (MFS) profile domain-containing protein n=1 Tax=Penicillium argentinense TaxID=1131581 RepID=A0A9W9FFL8_9EURO|nr:uncharacterized protein N7532_006319 [Penicillium argentinense]KAJ5099318.1 hypothetical protein N7532_006319 [Penicillium argentinense]